MDPSLCHSRGIFRRGRLKPVEIQRCPRILGRPYSIQDDLPDSVIFFGDLSHYLWFDREQMIIESTSTGGNTFAKHQVAVKVIERCDGKLGITEAFVKATGVTG